MRQGFCAFKLKKEIFVQLFLRYIHSHALLQRYGAPPLLEEGATHKEADADLNMRKAVHYVSALCSVVVWRMFFF